MAVVARLKELDDGDHALLLDFDSTAEVLGWADRQLIEHTDAVVRDVHCPDPAALTPRKWVQFWEAR
ncbi:hypothetical protein [Mycobacterium gastri]|uniref:Uncharacterized protein n=1 Tax=Mycobacterium gastri TaxID=1777 RepID=A0A1X1VEA1_MYCGS|nr:hypothetical protein MGAST_29555 [Mycobacterium gastri 'Wayne']ORV67450.1 hypothetical protein AWC07_01030 [Mycobacterium gastri]